LHSQTLESHRAAITALDFSEPYGTLVSASQEETQPRVWDLFSATEIGRLRGHTAIVKCLQVEDRICLTGSEDGNVRLWDLRRVEGDEWERGDVVTLSDVAEEDENADGEDDEETTAPNGIRPGKSRDVRAREGSCARVLEGHSKAVTALYFEDDCLVNFSVPVSLCFVPMVGMYRLQARQTRRCDNGTSQLVNV
jgi:mitochondrial division protein 1